LTACDPTFHVLSEQLSLKYKCSWNAQCFVQKTVDRNRCICTLCSHLFWAFTISCGQLTIVDSQTFWFEQGRQSSGRAGGAV